MADETIGFTVANSDTLTANTELISSLNGIVKVSQVNDLATLIADNSYANNQEKFLNIIKYIPGLISPTSAIGIMTDLYVPSAKNILEDINNLNDFDKIGIDLHKDIQISMKTYGRLWGTNPYKEVANIKMFINSISWNAPLNQNGEGFQEVNIIKSNDNFIIDKQSAANIIQTNNDLKRIKNKIAIAEVTLKEGKR